MKIGLELCTIFIQVIIATNKFVNKEQHIIINKPVGSFTLNKNAKMKYIYGVFVSTILQIVTENTTTQQKFM